MYIVVVGGLGRRFHVGPIGNISNGLDKAINVHHYYLEKSNPCTSVPCLSLDIMLPMLQVDVVMTI